ncbi:Aminodeoxyfutalosine deaminase [Roseivivax jejudonensis]|uniref:Aminodeoxyfutalosine deaminase n=1 Tax=Roseivivax jejudonensis TaxID=1529041 RepID=A0A1X6ZE88_9RHOB|nr:adenosine deaminase [Roseivivax jejudonensis]SLN48558.1 Aminodeoxyfutalosine deaminase [Roseivivax jejudonensis]
MRDDETLEEIARLPKVELHLHLEGAAPPAFVRGLAAEKRVDLGRIFRADGGYAFEGFGPFLSVYEAATSVIDGPEDYARLVRAVLETAAAADVVYCETFVSPDFCGGGDVAAWREHVAAMREAADAAERDLGVTMRGVVTCVRHFGPDRARRAARCAAETAGDWITGFGMGGDEAAGEQKDFAWAFDCAREAGLGLTTHAGEWRGPDEVRAALDHLRVSRIGHGVRAAEDPALLERLAEDGVVLEVCPGSNVALGVAPRLDAHPIATLRDAGVKVTVSTDDPPFFHTDMRAEYIGLARAFGWDAGDFDALARTALDAAFCDADTRARVARRLTGDERA